MGFAISTESPSSESPTQGLTTEGLIQSDVSPSVLRRDMLKSLYANAKRVHRLSSRITPVVLLLELSSRVPYDNKSILRT